jgi:hypothetical protein
MDKGFCWHKLWTSYLEESQDSFLEKVKTNYVTPATIKLLLVTGQLEKLDAFTPTSDEIGTFCLIDDTTMLSPQQHDHDDDKMTHLSKNICYQ